MRTVVVAALLAAVGCPAASPGSAGDPGGQFGTAKPVVDKGTLVGPTTAPAAPPNFEAALIVVPAYDAAKQHLTVVLKIADGFHAYAAGEEVGKPVNLLVDAANGWAMDGAAEIPAGTKKDLGALGVSVILEHEVVLGAKLKGGPGALSGIVEAQVCTDKACDRPRRHPWTIPPA